MKYDCIESLMKAGIAHVDAVQLRRISMQLHRWHELECGTNEGCIERDDDTNIPYLTFENGRGPRGRRQIPDRETAALNRLKKVLKKYPHIKYYVQGDPRGCALYILRPGDIPEGEQIDACYNRGIAVCK